MEVLRNAPYSRFHIHTCQRCGRHFMPKEERITLEGKNYCRQCGTIEREERAFDLIVTRYLR